eukprot:scaffold153953_cov35-Tisochrysis_lutea.AAC.1
MRLKYSTYVPPQYFSGRSTGAVSVATATSAKPGESPFMKDARGGMRFWTSAHIRSKQSRSLVSHSAFLAASCDANIVTISLVIFGPARKYVNRQSHPEPCVTSPFQISRFDGTLPSSGRVLLTYSTIDHESGKNSPEGSARSGTAVAPLTMVDEFCATRLGPVAGRRVARAGRMCAPGG